MTSIIFWVFFYEVKNLWILVEKYFSILSNTKEIYWLKLSFFVHILHFKFEKKNKPKTRKNYL